MQRPFLIPILIPGSSGFIPLAATLVLTLIEPAQAQSRDPIKIGVIAEVQSIAGAATPGGAQIAANGLFITLAPPKDGDQEAEIRHPEAWAPRSLASARTAWTGRSCRTLKATGSG